jgi:hypothetical protein
VDVKQQKLHLFHLSTTEILNKEYKYKIIARITQHYRTFAFTTQLINENSLKRCILWKFSFVCFATFVVQNLPARGRKTEKNKEVA